jgi:hypothetical protein
MLSGAAKTAYMRDYMPRRHARFKVRTTSTRGRRLSGEEIQQGTDYRGGEAKRSHHC